MKGVKIFVIVIVSSFLLVVLGSLSIVSFTGLIRLLQEVLAFISEHLKEAIIFLFGGIGLWAISIVVKWYFDRKKQMAQMKHPKVVETLRDFINPLINDLEMKIHLIDNSLHDERFAYPIELLAEPNYKCAHDDILNERNVQWIKDQINGYNKRAETIKGQVQRFREAIKGSLNQRYEEDIIKDERNKELLAICIADNDKERVGNPEGIYGFYKENRDELLALRNDEVLRECINDIKQRLNEARKIATEFVARLEKLKERHMKESVITVEETEKKEGEIGGGSW